MSWLRLLTNIRLISILSKTSNLYIIWDDLGFVCVDSPCRPIVDFTECGLTLTPALVLALTLAGLPRRHLPHMQSYSSIHREHREGVMQIWIIPLSWWICFISKCYRHFVRVLQLYYICSTIWLSHICNTTWDLSMQTCKYHRNPGKYLRTLNIYYLKKYRIDIIDYVQQLNML